jgi:DNA-binding response OmpR family regulator
MSKSKSIASKKILVVEDDPDILNVINIMLGLEGYDVEVLTNGKPILEKQSVVPDLYILDKMLPQVDGTEICQFLKSQPVTKHIPVIMISANQRSRDAALQAGATTFIEKPFRMHNFLNYVASALEITPKNKWFSL